MAKKSRKNRRLIPAKKNAPRIPHRTPLLWFSLILIIATLIAYQPLRHKEFIAYDTDKYVTDNPNVNQGLTLASIKWAFTQEHVANYHPLTWLSHMLDCQLFGLDHPFWHHFVNWLFHLLNTLLLFWVLRKFTHAMWPAFFVAALFALHPLHVESVAWIAERKDLLSGFFWLLTIAFYFYYAQKPNLIRYLPVFFSLALGLLAKPMLVTLPFVLLLLDYWPLNRLFPPTSTTQKIQTKFKITPTKPIPLFKLLLEKMPLFALVVASCIVTFLAQQSGGAVKTAESFPLDVRFFNALISYLSYLLKMIFPVNLAVLYPHPGADIFWWHWLGSFLILALITLAVFFFARRHRYLAVGWFWYLGALVPVIGLVQVGVQAYADRYTYIPLIGIFIMLAWGADRRTQNWPHRPIVLTILTCVVLLPLIVLTRMQLAHWQNSHTLFQHTLAVTQNNYIMHHNFGRILADQGDNTEAQKHFACAVEINPNYANAHNNLGVVLGKQGQYQLALESLKKALQLRGPDNPDSFNTYQNMAQSYAFLKDIPNAIRHSRRALKLKPDSYETLTTLAWLLATSADSQSRNGAEAVSLALRACQLTNHQWPSALRSLAAAYAETGQFTEAVDTVQKAIDLFRSQGLALHADNAERQLKLYQAQKPYRDK